MNSRKYKHIFFDLDHTLWDYEKNAFETLTEIYDKYKLSQFGFDAASFIKKCSENNVKAWELYRKNEITRDILRKKRFTDTFSELGVELIHFPETLPDTFLELCPNHTHLIEGTNDLLEHLSGKYAMHIITNGFEESQHRKLKNCNIQKYFTEIITSDRAKAKKPDKQIFDYALGISSSVATEAIMIGDELEFDVVGAKNSGIDQIYFNPDNKNHRDLPTFSVQKLAEIKTILI